MTTYSTDTRIRHDSDANFREWGSEFSGALSTIGLTQTADTGQINWTTVTRAAANNDAGYEIWRFNDTAHSTSPLFMRFNYGTNNGSNRPRLQIELGTGSNGTGTITGQIRAATNAGLTNSDQTSDTTRSSYWCYNATHGVFWFFFKYLGSNFAFHINRTCDNTAAADARGIVASWSAVSSSSLTWRLSRRFSTGYEKSSASVSAVAMAAALWQNGATADAGGDYPVYPGFAALDTTEFVPLNTMCMVNTAAATQFTTLTTTLVGASARTFMACPVGSFPMDAANSASHYPCLLWE